MNYSLYILVFMHLSHRSIFVEKLLGTQRCCQGIKRDALNEVPISRKLKFWTGRQMNDKKHLENKQRCL